MRADIEILCQIIEDHIVIPLLTNEQDSVMIEAHGYKLIGQKTEEGFWLSVTRECRKMAREGLRNLKD
jgi:hypothetical protein